MAESTSHQEPVGIWRPFQHLLGNSTAEDPPRSRGIAPSPIYGLGEPLNPTPSPS